MNVRASNYKRYQYAQKKKYADAQRKLCLFGIHAPYYALYSGKRRKRSMSLLPDKRNFPFTRPGFYLCFPSGSSGTIALPFGVDYTNDCS
jgi:hypothetical protein